MPSDTFLSSRWSFPTSAVIRTTIVRVIVYALIVTLLFISLIEITLFNKWLSLISRYLSQAVLLLVSITTPLFISILAILFVIVSYVACDLKAFALGCGKHVRSFCTKFFINDPEILIN